MFSVLSGNGVTKCEVALEAKVGIQKHWVFNRMVKRYHCVRTEKDIAEIQNIRCKILILLRFLSRMTFRSKKKLTKIHNRNRNTTYFDRIEKAMCVKQANYSSYIVMLSFILAGSYG